MIGLNTTKTGRIKIIIRSKSICQMDCWYIGILKCKILIEKSILTVTGRVGILFQLGVLPTPSIMALSPAQAAGAGLVNVLPFPVTLSNELLIPRYAIGCKWNM